MKIFAYEHSSGSGLMNASRPHLPTYRGEMILRALLRDLSTVAGVEVITMRDPRLPKLDLPVSSVHVPEYGKFEQSLNACIEAVDAVWPIAPESDGILEHLSRKVIRHQRILLGCRPQAVHVAASKTLTTRALSNAGIPVVDTYLPEDDLPSGIEAWVVKPDDGADCFDTRLFSSAEKALAWIHASNRTGYVMQPFIFGKPCSLSLLCCDGTAWILGRNEQRIVVSDNQFHYLGCTVNGVADAPRELDRLAQQVAFVMPGLWGYVGVDFIMTNNGAVVLEVNPGITPSCAGLHASIKHNPVELILALLQERAGMRVPKFKPIAVSIDVDAFNSL